MNPNNPNEDGLTFAEWQKAVDRELIRLCDMPADCLADYPAYDMWNDSVPPLEAAVECLVEWNDYPADLIDAEAGR